jgi:CheY-like chemotaxis protein
MPLASSPDALAMLEQTPADVVVSDMRMPFMDGAELLTRFAPLAGYGTDHPFWLFRAHINPANASGRAPVCL